MKIQHYNMGYYLFKALLLISSTFIKILSSENSVLKEYRGDIPMWHRKINMCIKDGRKTSLNVFLVVSIFTSRVDSKKYTHWFLRHLDITFPLFPMSNN